MKSILFSTEMVQAILDGKKTQTRRICKITVNGNQPVDHKICTKAEYPARNCEGICAQFYDESYRGAAKPRYRVGDILYVRETWNKVGGNYIYRADLGDYLDACETLTGGYPDYCRYHPGCEGCTRGPQRIYWKPSIHMPKDAARIFLKVTDVRVERLQDIDEDGVWNEGYHGCPQEHMVYFPEGGAEPCFNTNDCSVGYKRCLNYSVEEEFAMDIWNPTIKPSELDKYGYEANPWVWVYTFEKIEKELVE